MACRSRASCIFLVSPRNNHSVLFFGNCLPIESNVEEDGHRHEDLAEELDDVELVLLVTVENVVGPQDREWEQHNGLLDDRIFVFNNLHAEVGRQGIQEHDQEHEHVELFLLVHVFDGEADVFSVALSHGAESVRPDVRDHEHYKG